jgi:hypothetical protein
MYELREGSWLAHRYLANYCDFIDMQEPKCIRCAAQICYIDPQGNSWLVQWINREKKDVGLVEPFQAHHNEVSDGLYCLSCNFFEQW